MTLCQLLDKAPEETKEPTPPAPNSGEQSPPASEPQPPEPAKAVPQEPLPASVPQRPARTKELKSGKLKTPDEDHLSPALAPQPVASPEIGHHAGYSADQEKGSAAASGDIPANSAPAIESNTPIASSTPAPAGQGLEIKPGYKETPEPQYPALARRMGYQGTVELKILVNRSGMVEEMQVVSSSGYPVLDQSALTAVQRWRFEPGTRDAVKEAMWIKIPVNFKLR